MTGTGLWLFFCEGVAGETAVPRPPRFEVPDVSLLLPKRRLEDSTEFRARVIEAAPGNGLPTIPTARNSQPKSQVQFQCNQHLQNAD